jgi:hypothetical protein
MKKTIEIFLPVAASARFSLTVPDSEAWDKMTNEQKFEHFMDQSECVASLCYSCSDDIESNWDLPCSFELKDFVEAMENQ